MNQSYVSVYVAFSCDSEFFKKNVYVRRIIGAVLGQGGCKDFATISVVWVSLDGLFSVVYYINYKKYC